MNPNDPDASRFKSATSDRRGERDLDDLLVHVARGDTEAFEALYDRLAGPVYGVIRRVLRDPSQSEEVAQEVLLVATVVLAAERQELAVVTSGLPALPAGQVYQLWLIGKTKTTSAGLLPPARSGQTPPVLATGVKQGDALGLTVEPAPGSAQPTTTPILALPLPV
jgi:Anti-sigma-K factor rskA